MALKGYARLVNIGLGVWLFLSSFLWPHSQQQYLNAWVVGILVTTIALASFWIPQVRFLNTALAAWLFISSWVLSWISMETLLHHAAVAVAIFIVSLIPIPPRAASSRRITSGSLMDSPHSA